MEKRFKFELSSAALHTVAMAIMLCDHLWGTIVPGNDWLTCIGQLLCLRYINHELLGGFTAAGLSFTAKSAACSLSMV